ncbi:MAG TPA: hypothetical protein PLU72_19755 [Candidatus Ozemobacteraceae bacterium]|nr:hypothetical protein [Candidatus Ozemobacteraceae bacterium]
MVLVFLLILEPAMIQAIDLSPLGIQTIREQNVRIGVQTPESELLLPHEQLELIIKQFGRTQQELEDQALAEAMFILLHTYDLFTQEAAETFSFLGAIQDFRSQWGNMRGTSDLPGASRAVGALGSLLDDFVVHITSFFVAESGKPHARTFIQNCWNALAASSKRFDQLWKTGKAPVNQVIQVLDNFSGTPDSWDTTKGWVRWLKKVGQGQSAQTAAENIANTAMSIGVAFYLIGIFTSVTTLLTSEDTRGGARLFSYENVKTTVDLYFSYVALVFMLVPSNPISMIAGFVMLAEALIVRPTLDYIGDRRQAWVKAYKSSHLFLYNKDDVYRKFFEGKDSLKPEERSLAWVKADKLYPPILNSQPASAGEVKKRLIDVYTAARHQGILMAYYQSPRRDTSQFPSYSLIQLKQMWKQKADYMSWKPDKENLKQNIETDPNYKKMVDAVNKPSRSNPVTSNKRFLATAKQAKELCFFNPDFALIWRLRQYGGAKVNAIVSQDPFFGLVYLRMQQAPFHYLPLLENQDWTSSVLRAGLSADMFLSGVKTLASLYSMLKMLSPANEEMAQKSVKEFDHVWRAIFEGRKLSRLVGRLIAYADDPSKLPKDLESELREADVLDDATLTALRSCKSSSEFAGKIGPRLRYLSWRWPGLLGYAAVAAVTLGYTYKKAIDRHAILKAYLDVRAEALNTPQTIPLQSLRRFLIEGKCLESENQFQDWLAGIHPPAADYQHYLNLCRQEIGTGLMLNQLFQGDTDAASYIRKTLSEANAALGEWKKLADKLDGIGIKVKWPSSHKMYGPYEFPANISLSVPIKDVTTRVRAASSNH